MQNTINADTNTDSSRYAVSQHYLQSAVSLALITTKHLINLLGTYVHLKVEDLTTDKLIVLVKPGATLQSDEDAKNDDKEPEIEGVGFLFEFEGELPPLPLGLRDRRSVNAV